MAQPMTAIHYWWTADSSFFKLATLDTTSWHSFVQSSMIYCLHGSQRTRSCSKRWCWSVRTRTESPSNAKTTRATVEIFLLAIMGLWHASKPAQWSCQTKQVAHFECRTDERQLYNNRWYNMPTGSHKVSGSQRRCFVFSSWLDKTVRTP